MAQADVDRRERADFQAVQLLQPGQAVSDFSAASPTASALAQVLEAAGHQVRENLNLGSETAEAS